MIWDALITVFLGLAANVITFLGSFFPDVSIPTIGTLVHGYALINSVLPVAEVFDVATLTLEVLVGLAGAYAVTWGLRKIPVFGPK